jgi:hypothetical protein
MVFGGEQIGGGSSDRLEDKENHDALDSLVSLFASQKSTQNGVSILTKNIARFVSCLMSFNAFGAIRAICLGIYYFGYVHNNKQRE